LRPVAIDELLKAPPVGDADLEVPDPLDGASVNQGSHRLRNVLGAQVEITG
jgi:hypothetical protein